MLVLLERTCILDRREDGGNIWLGAGGAPSIREIGRREMEAGAGLSQG